MYADRDGSGRPAGDPRRGEPAPIPRAWSCRLRGDRADRRGAVRRTARVVAAHRGVAVGHRRRPDHRPRRRARRRAEHPVAGRRRQRRARARRARALARALHRARRAGGAGRAVRIAERRIRGDVRRGARTAANQRSTHARAEPPVDEGAPAGRERRDAATGRRHRRPHERARRAGRAGGERRGRRPAGERAGDRERPRRAPAAARRRGTVDGRAADRPTTTCRPG